MYQISIEPIPYPEETISGNNNKVNVQLSNIYIKHKNQLIDYLRELEIPSKNYRTIFIEIAFSDRKTNKEINRPLSGFVAIESASKPLLTALKGLNIIKDTKDFYELRVRVIKSSNGGFYKFKLLE